MNDENHECPYYMIRPQPVYGLIHSDTLILESIPNIRDVHSIQVEMSPANQYRTPAYI